MSDEYKAAQAKLMLEQASDVDVIITTALIPGRKAPVLVNQEMLNVMKAGSVIVDLAAANGGNVAQTEANKVITTENGVTIIGYTDLPSRLASTSSQLVSASRCSLTSAAHMFCLSTSLMSYVPLFFICKNKNIHTQVWEQCCQVHPKHWSTNNQRKGCLPN